jgi:hypothetical protein
LDLVTLRQEAVCFPLYHPSVVPISRLVLYWFSTRGGLVQPAQLVSVNRQRAQMYPRPGTTATARLVQLVRAEETNQPAQIS